jgi:hypothetical protein
MADRKTGDVVVAVAAAATAARLLQRGWIARFTQRFSAIAIRHGIRNGSRTWMYAGAAASTFHYLNRFFGKKEEVKRIKLKPGERIEIREIPAATRRE